MYIGNVWTEVKVQNWFSVIKFIIFLSLSKKKIWDPLQIADIKVL